MTEYGSQAILTPEAYERAPVRARAERLVRAALEEAGVKDVQLEWWYDPDPTAEDDDGNTVHFPPHWELNGWGEK